jgi:hypothetical protein
MHGIKAGIIHRSTRAVLMSHSFDGSTPRRIGAELAPVTSELRAEGAMEQWFAAFWRSLFCWMAVPGRKRGPERDGGHQGPVFASVAGKAVPGMAVEIVKRGESFTMIRSIP